jgi:hypothetical protein
LDIRERKKDGVTEYGMMMSFVICNVKPDIKYEVLGRNNRIISLRYSFSVSYGK